MNRVLRWGVGTVVIASGLVALALWDRQVAPETPGIVATARVATDSLDARNRQNGGIENGGDDDQILFGDLHVHTTFSMDAFVWALPLMQGPGARPPADACDYARYCASLDFYAHTDHAESLTPRHWSMIKDTVRACNEAAGPADNPDVVAFLGWEWTQMGNTPETHYGHKNVILRDTAEDAVPTRPIVAGGVPFRAMRHDPQPPIERALGPYVADFANRKRQFLQQDKRKELVEVPVCPEGVNTRDLPTQCIEVANEPKDLFRKLDEWGYPALVIPHGTAWGYYTPPGSNWTKQLTREQHDPKRQTLIEVYSGHGNSESYRDWRAIAYDAEGGMVCPDATDDYLPCCKRAGQIIRSRCDDPASADCAAKVTEVEQAYLKAGRGGQLTVADVKPEDWLNCGQCTDCFLPPLNHRPGNSVQAIMALNNPAERDDDGRDLRFRFGFIGSSDNHAAEPGTGFKQAGRHSSTESRGAANQIVQQRFVDRAKPTGNPQQPRHFELGDPNSPFNFLQVNETERLSSFLYTGGLAAVHTHGRSREQIWDALQRKEVYGTSGPRMLLWFDLIDNAGQRHPMGSELEGSDVPHFRVRALGAFEQKPGCPAWTEAAIGVERVEQLCGGECFNPGDTRTPIERIEVVRIRRQTDLHDDPGPLIEDPWKVMRCSDEGNGCSVEFDDPDYPGTDISGQKPRETLYYVRAIHRAEPTINGAQLRCDYDEQGRCVAVKPCYGDARTPLDDQCLAEVEHRAWSSPIFLMPPG
ncbi:DUF3604 domain-containing protein [Sinimarinibacterium sp. CAU 1509]|uniref:DUF3604 domain-containing protein n=1 Tax=Sinimarinibacterium sp. CAU 1509 TaxID=2562283 RepID=UPI00146C7C5D|nr:DUF3604 domain-containing protein [Sinimarinibacterium sp. CAU 1509]